MKVAIQFFGHLRTYDKCYPAVKKHILDIYKPDVFIHTWDRLEHQSRSWYKDEVRGEPSSLDESLVSDLVAKYQPKKIRIDTQKSFYDDTVVYGSHETIKITLNGIKNMLLSQNISNELRIEYELENGIEYDWVIVIRPDVAPLEPLDLSKFTPQLEFNDRTSFHMVHNSINMTFDRWILNYPLVFDVFYLGRPLVINTITSALNSFEKYFIQYTKYLPKGVENPEQALAEYIRANCISIKLYKFSFAIRRVNNKDDIVWVPENATSLICDHIQYKRHLKLKLKDWMRNFCVALLSASPNFVKESFYKFVNRLVTIRGMVK